MFKHIRDILIFIVISIMITGCMSKAPTKKQSNLHWSWKLERWLDDTGTPVIPDNGTGKNFQNQ